MSPNKNTVDQGFLFLLGGFLLEICPSGTTALSPWCSPLDLPDLLTQPGEVLGELHHHDDDSPSGQHAGRPQQ